MSSTSTTLTPSLLHTKQHSVLWSVPPVLELAMERGEGKGDKEARKSSYSPLGLFGSAARRPDHHTLVESERVNLPERTIAIMTTTER